MKIRLLKQNEFFRLKEMIPPEWNFDVLQFMKIHFNQPYFIPLIAEDSDEIAGMGNGICTGTTVWVGNIIVKMKFRRRGIGTALTKEVINRLEEMKCRSFLLIATSDGFPVYQKIGFKTVSHYNFYFHENPPVIRQHHHIRPFSKPDFSTLLHLDHQATGEQRDLVLCRVTCEAVVFDDDMIRGFYLSHFGNGYVLANDPASGYALLSHKMAQHGHTIVIPEQNTDACSFLEKSGYYLKNQAPRMLLGEDVSWKPGMIWSRAGGYSG